MKVARWLGVALGSLIVSTAAAQPPRVVSEGPAVQVATTQYVIHSTKTGRDHLIKVTVPFSPVPAGQTRPVVYALDGGYEVAGPIGWVLGGSGAMRQAFVVSVGYLPADYGWRDPDLAFRAYEDGGRKIGAGGAAFRAFLNAELRPFVATRYPVDDRQAVLLGHSEGALFAANLLADHPQDYAGYVVASPSVWSDPSIVARLRQGGPKIGGAKVYLAVGGAETPRMLAGERQIEQALRSAGVELESRVFDGATHLAYYPALVAEALPWLLRP
jgi:predicted alpha/beta superfamily hydrolase